MYWHYYWWFELLIYQLSEYWLIYLSVHLYKRVRICKLFICKYLCRCIQTLWELERKRNWEHLRWGVMYCDDNINTHIRTYIHVSLCYVAVYYVCRYLMLFCWTQNHSQYRMDVWLHQKSTYVARQLHMVEIINV